MIIKPFAKKNNIPVIFSVDNNYMPYLSVCIDSLIENASSNNNYDIWILYRNLSSEVQQTIKNTYSKSNISIRFLDMNAAKLLNESDFFISNHASIANYYRLFIPKIFHNYTKVLYLDCDILINTDIAKLYNIDLKGKTLGVVKDACTYFNPNFWYKYCIEQVKIKHPCNYFNSGILVCDVNKMIQTNLTERCLEKLKEFKPICWDQCILNSVLEDDVLYLDQRWNFQWHWLLPEFAEEYPQKYVEDKFLQEYLKSAKSPFIIHFTSRVKAWHRWHTDLGKLWWKHAEKSPFFDIIYERNKKAAIKEHPDIPKETKTSVIVPVYNVAKYLKTCLDSLIKQTLKDIEIICIDDGSTDGSLEILEQYASKDKRIIIIKQPNSGQGTARNKGLSIARGKYIQFLDSDDFYELNCCETLYKIMEGTNVDVTCFQPYVKYDAYASRAAEDKSYFQLKYDKLQSMQPDMIRKIDVNCWNKIFRKSFLDKQKIRFPEKLHFEDVAFFWFWTSKAKNVYFLKQELMCYVRRPNSFVANIFEKQSNHIFDQIQVNELIYNWLKKHNCSKELLREFLLYTLYKTNWLLNAFYESDIVSKRKMLDELSKFMKKFTPIAKTLEDKNKKLYEYIVTRNYHRFKIATQINVHELYPAYKNKNVPIVFAVDKNYVEYLSVAIQSIVDNSDTRNNYDIVILHQDLYEYQQRMMLDIINGYTNISIRFVHMKSFMQEYRLAALITINHITTAAYFRLLAAKLFANYNKIIYLDCDIIVNSDIALLYNTDIQDKSIAAVLDTTIAYNLDTVLLEKGLQSYLKDYLDIDDISKYFNSGVIIINVDKWKKNKIENKLLLLAKQNHKYFHDQNVLNSAFHNDCFILPATWNFQYHVKFTWPTYHLTLPAELIELYDDIKQKPCLIHYTSSVKPWNSLYHSYTSDWWKYAKKSPFYEILLRKITVNNTAKATPVKKTAPKEIKHKNLVKFKYHMYRLLSHCFKGKLHIKYLNKKKKYKEKVELIKNSKQG